MQRNSLASVAAKLLGAGGTAKRTITLVTAVAAVLVLSGVAGATPPTITTGSLPNTGTIDCGTFVIAYSGTLSYRETDFYDNAGNFVRAQSKVAVTETDTNTSTGNSIALRSDYTVTDYADGSEAINGEFWMGNEQGAGHVIQDVGRILYATDGSVVLKGPHDVIAAGDEAAFCAELS